METSISESSQWLITHRFDNDGTFIGRPRINPRVLLKLYRRYRRLFGDSNKAGTLFSYGHSSGRGRYLIVGARTITGGPAVGGLSLPFGRDYRFQDGCLGNYNTEIWPSRYWQEVP
jgi:hypothetical protein